MARCTMCKWVSLLLMLWGMPALAAPWHTLGTPATSDEIASWDIDVRPDGAGLPPGQGSVAEGQEIYDRLCASCHGTFGESNDYIALTGGVGTLASDNPQRTVGSKLNFATTLWDYINRAMPFNNSKTLSANEVYALTAYVLNLNEIVPADAVLDAKSLPLIKMPNAKGFTADHGLSTIDGAPDVKNSACMQDCADSVSVLSRLPEEFTAQMYGDIRTHFRAVRALQTAGAGPDAAPSALLQTYGCVACHGLDKAGVGPALRDVAARYAKDPRASATLVAKVAAGGSGAWGSAMMPPQSQVPAQKLTEIVAWILSGAKD